MLDLLLVLGASAGRPPAAMPHSAAVSQRDSFLTLQLPCLFWFPCLSASKDLVVAVLLLLDHVLLLLLLALLTLQLLENTMKYDAIQVICATHTRAHTHKDRVLNDNTLMPSLMPPALP